jgi:hypothetical protein
VQVCDLDSLGLDVDSPPDRGKFNEHRAPQPRSPPTLSPGVVTTWFSSIPDDGSISTGSGAPEAYQAAKAAELPRMPERIMYEETDLRAQPQPQPVAPAQDRARISPVAALRLLERAEAEAAERTDSAKRIAPSASVKSTSTAASAATVPISATQRMYHWWELDTASTSAAPNVPPDVSAPRTFHERWKELVASVRVDCGISSIETQGSTEDVPRALHPMVDTFDASRYASALPRLKEGSNANRHAERYEKSAITRVLDEDPQKTVESPSMTWPISPQWRNHQSLQSPQSPQSRQSRQPSYLATRPGTKGARSASQAGEGTRHQSERPMPVKQRTLNPSEIATTA